MKKTYILFLFLCLFLKNYSQQKSHTLFSKDSLFSVANYVNQYNLMDSLVISLKKKRLTLTEKDIIPFYQVATKGEDLGICPFATNIQNLDKHWLFVTAAKTMNFTTSMYIFLIDKKTTRLVHTYLIESNKKAVTPFVYINRKKILMPYRENFVLNDSIKVLDKKKQTNTNY